MPNKKILTLSMVMFLMQGCFPAVLGGVATTASVLHDRRSAGTIVDDNALELKIKNNIGQQPFLADNSRVDVTAYNGTVLLTGEVFNDAIRQQIGQLAQSVAGVKRVENHLTIGRRSTLGERAFDAGQTTKVKAALFDVSLPNFDPTRVKVVTEHGYTYLMGLVTAAEAEAATTVARHVSDVREVINLFEIIPPSIPPAK